MATENKVLDVSFEADEDLSNDQYRIVVLDATSGKVRRPNAITDIPLGILQNARQPALPKSVSIRQRRNFKSAAWRNARHRRNYRHGVC